MKTPNNKKIQDLLEEGEAWEKKERGRSSKKLSLQETENLLNKMDLHLVAIRLPTDVIEKLKKIARKEGLKYQPYVRRLLVQHVEEEKQSLEDRVKKLEYEIAEIKKTG